MAEKESKLTVTFTLRLPYGLMDSIKKDIDESGEFSSVSSWVNTACREYLAKRKRDRGGNYSE